MTNTKKPHRALLIFVGVCMMMAGGMGLVLNVIGNYFVPMAVEFGLTGADGNLDVTKVTLIMTVYSYVMLIWLPICGRLFQKIRAQLLFGTGGLLIVLGVALLSIWTKVWQIYISGVLWGLGGPIIFLVGPSFLISSWFAPRLTGRFLGISSAFTGVGTFIWSPVFARLIQTAGYRKAFLVEAVIAAVLILIPSFCFFRTRPQDVGLEPYGAEKEDSAGRSEAKSGVSDKAALKKPAFWCIFIVACLISLGGGFKSMMPTAVQSIGGESLAILGAYMISAAAVGNIIGKIVFGALSDKIGIQSTFFLFAALAAAGFAVMFLLLGGSMAPMLFAGFCIGTTDAMMSVGLPLLTRSCFGDREYAKIYSYLNMGIAVLGGLGTVFVAQVAARAGGFKASYGFGVIFMAVIVISVLLAIANAAGFRDDWTTEKETEET